MTTKKQYAKIAQIGCVLCYHFGYSDTPAELHHIRRFGGKRENSPIIPLCTEHHRGNTGVHGLGAKGFEKLHKVTFDTLLDIVRIKLNENRM